jgi:hypothetical protein
MRHFLSLGAQKSGTAWLYENLSPHPGISFPAGKEVRFWDQHHSRGYGWHRSLFETPELADKIAGEITPAYAILPVAEIRAAHSRDKSPLRPALRPFLENLYRSRTKRFQNYLAEHFPNIGHIPS